MANIDPITEALYFKDWNKYGNDMTKAAVSMGYSIIYSEYVDHPAYEVDYENKVIILNRKRGANPIRDNVLICKAIGHIFMSKPRIYTEVDLDEDKRNTQFAIEVLVSKSQLDDAIIKCTHLRYDEYRLNWNEITKYLNADYFTIKEAMRLYERQAKDARRNKRLQSLDSESADAE